VWVLCPAAYNKISHHVTQPNSNVWFFLVEIDVGMTGASYELICKHLIDCATFHVVLVVVVVAIRSFSVQCS
jgi:hypothetical protein